MFYRQLDESGNITAVLSSLDGDFTVFKAGKKADADEIGGYGSTLVSAVYSDFGGKVYLMREEDINESFYKRLAFENAGIWRMYK